MRQQSEPDRCVSAYQQLLVTSLVSCQLISNFLSAYQQLFLTKSNKMTICLLSLVSISAIPCERQQDANASLSDITEERKVGQEVDEEEEEVEVALGKGEHISQYVQILDFLEGKEV